MKEQVVSLFGKVKPQPETTDKVKKNLALGAKAVGLWAAYCGLFVITVLGTALAIDRGAEKLGLNKPLEVKQVK